MEAARTHEISLGVLNTPKRYLIPRMVLSVFVGSREKRFFTHNLNQGKERNREEYSVMDGLDIIS